MKTWSSSNWERRARESRFIHGNVISNWVRLANDLISFASDRDVCIIGNGLVVSHEILNLQFGRSRKQVFAEQIRLC